MNSKADSASRQRAKNAKENIALRRSRIEQQIASKRRVADLVGEYARQRPEVAVQIIKQWLNS